MHKRMPERLKLKLLEGAGADMRARPIRRRNGSSDRSATSTFHKRISFPKAVRAQMRNEFWKPSPPQTAAGPNQSRPATTDRNSERTGPGAQPMRRPKPLRAVKAHLRG